MAGEWIPAVIGGVAGLGTGVLGSIFAPWSQWGVEKKRLRRQQRVEQVQSWREGVAAIRDYNHEPWNEADGEWQPRVSHLDRAVDVKSQAWFSTLAPHLTPNVRTFCEVPPATSYRPDVRATEMVERLTTEIARIERKYVDRG